VIVAHLSDLHLGFRAYGRIERGVDMRERDVAAAFERAIAEVVRLRPQVVVVAGDVFDRPDPPASAVVSLARGLELLRSTLPETPVLMVAGPRDTPRRPGDPGALAVLDTFPNVEAATGLTRSILIDRLGLHACLVPYRAVSRHPPAPPEPDPRMRWNVLVLHAEASHGRDDGVHVDPAEWDYVALGGEHRARKVEQRIRYSGSLERVALDPWDEATDEKGFLTVDLERGQVAFHPIQGRPVVALAPVKVGRGDPERLRRRVREVTGEVPGGIGDKIVRLRLRGATPFALLALQG
jgi:DNA repair exonuclease SbcCD nuclease subunit